MTTAAGSPQSMTVQIDDLIRQWGAYRLVVVRDAPSSIAKRLEILTRITNDCGAVGLFTTAPDTVSRHYYGGRHQTGRRTRTARLMAATLEDFREWHTTMCNQGDV